MIPLERLSLEDEHYNQRKDCQRYHLLDNLELHQVEGASIPLETHPVGRNCQAVLEKSYSPRKENDQDERPSRADFHFAEFQMPIPGKCHENIRCNKHQYRPDTVHISLE